MADVELHPFNPMVAEKQRTKLDEIKKTRNSNEVNKALQNLKEAAQSEDNVMPHVLEAVKSYATLGEITRILKEIFGEFKEPVGL
jgi:methylmalonyl-CoA mutase N-terminal domain/subunit